MRGRAGRWGIALAAVSLGCAGAPGTRGGMTATVEPNRTDRTVPPSLGAPPTLELPPIHRHRLSNGLAVLIVEQRDLPVVDLQLVVRAGAAADSPAQAGRASLTAELLDEGTANHDALGLAEAIDYLGAELETAASWDASFVSLHVLTPRLAPALQLLAEVVLTPTFPEAEVERVRDERLAYLLQQQDEPRALASRAFAGVVYGAEHPYGAPVLGTRESVARLDRDALVEFYRTYYRPNNAFLVAVGDVDAATLLPLLEQAFAGWTPAEVPAIRVPPPPPAGATAIHLVDRPGSAQSEIRVGLAGPPRATPDYFPLVVMNTVLGGSFTSRLNMALREERGYTYGAGSGFDFRQGAGPFVASSAVFTGVTDSALVVFFDEIRRIRDEPVPAEELDRAKNYVALGLPRGLETTAEVAARVAEIELYGLGDDYLTRYMDRVRAVTAEDVQRVARRYLDPDHLAVIVVGDRGEIEEALARLGIGAVRPRAVE